MTEYSSGPPARGRAIAMLCITAVLWSTSGLLIKLVNWHPMAIAGARSFIALFPIMLVHGRPRPMKGFAQIAAAVCYAATLLLYVTANKLTTAANVILLQYTAPIYVVLLSAWLMKEKIRLKDAITIFAVMAGLVLFFFDQLDARGLWGNVLSLISGVTLAFFTIFMKMQKDGSPIDSIIWGNILTTAIGLPFILINGAPDARSWAGLLLLGIFQLGLSYVFYVKAIKHVSTVEMILIPIIEPVLNPIIVAAATGEMPGMFAIIGGVIVLAGVTTNFLIKNQGNQSEEACRTDCQKSQGESKYVSNIK